MQTLKRSFAIDFKRNSVFSCLWARLSHCEIAFHNANVLASHKGASYNRFHRLQQFCNLRCLLHLLLWWIKPEPLVRVFFRLHFCLRGTVSRPGTKAGWLLSWRTCATPLSVQAVADFDL